MPPSYRRVGPNGRRSTTPRCAPVLFVLGGPSDERSPEGALTIRFRVPLKVSCPSVDSGHMRKLLVAPIIAAVLAILPAGIASATDTVNNSINNVSGTTIYVTPVQVSKWGSGPVNFNCSGPYAVAAYQTKTVCDPTFDVIGSSIGAEWNFNGTYNNVSFSQCVVVDDPGIGKMQTFECGSSGPVKAVWPFSNIAFNKTGGSCYTLQLTVPGNAAGRHESKKSTHHNARRPKDKVHSSCG